jgi:hypothetical protein
MTTKTITPISDMGASPNTKTTTTRTNKMTRIAMIALDVFVDVTTSLNCLDIASQNKEMITI